MLSTDVGSAVSKAVLEHGPISATELGDLLGFTPAAVRRRLGTFPVMA